MHLWVQSSSDPMDDAASHWHEIPFLCCSQAATHPLVFNVHPQLHAHSFEFNPSPPLLDVPAASNLLQPPGDARTKVSSHLVNDVLLNLHAWTHRATDQSDNEDSQDAIEGDAVDAADSIDPETDDF